MIKQPKKIGFLNIEANNFLKTRNMVVPLFEKFHYPDIFVQLSNQI